MLDASLMESPTYDKLSSCVDEIYQKSIGLLLLLIFWFSDLFEVINFTKFYKI